MTPIVRPTGKYSIATSIDFLRRIFYETIVVSAASATSSLGAGETDDQRSFDPDLNLGAGEFSLAGGQVWKERTRTRCPKVMDTPAIRSLVAGNRLEKDPFLFERV
ncbi:hypothetical protein PILCRDRAFT_826946 [Piloderma croceum F 1598]|uniref:Uncharacterized protein n=1 Tax=Piloderma croceum (strain F 1598) TaxID=765440 RepID=A0A0C3BEN9_PILCF|nr:hypothetical protein PILCRDRAFT_826946 [Piloderma croceum F 1598]